MKKRHLKIAGFVTVAAMLLNMILAPTAMARIPEEDVPLKGKEPKSCGCGGSIDQELLGKVKVEELTSLDLHKALSQALDDKDVKLLQRLFISKGHTAQVSEASGWKIYLEDNPGDSSVTFVNIPFKVNSTAYARILIATDGTATWVAGGSFAETTDGSMVADLYDVVDGSLEHYVVERAGDGTITNKTTGQEIGLAAGGFWYNVCLAVCGFIRSMGCVLSGAVVCGMACAAFPPIYPECWAMCTLLWWYICVQGMTEDCATLCEWIVG